MDLGSLSWAAFLLKTYFSLQIASQFGVRFYEFLPTDTKMLTCSQSHCEFRFASSPIMSRKHCLTVDIYFSATSSIMIPEPCVKKE